MATSDRQREREQPDRTPRGPRGIRLDPAAPRSIEWAAERIAEGGVVALPTDTVYGIAASLSHPDALRRLREIKRRPDGKPFPILLASVEELGQVAAGVDEAVVSLADRYWPGPLTVVVPARQGMPPEVVGLDDAGRPTVGVRVPNHPLALEVIAKAGGALAVTSANRSGEPPARTAAEVGRSLGDEIDMLLDGGRAPGGIPSTVVAVDGGVLRVLRAGEIPEGSLRAAWDVRRGLSGGA